MKTTLQILREGYERYAKEPPVKVNVQAVKGSDVRPFTQYMEACCFTKVIPTMTEMLEDMGNCLAAIQTSGYINPEWVQRCLVAYNKFQKGEE